MSSVPRPITSLQISLNITHETLLQILTKVKMSDQQIKSLYNTIHIVESIQHKIK